MVVDVRLDAVVDVDEVLEQGEGVAHPLEARRELTVVHDGLEVGVVEEVAQLVVDVAEVHVHRDGPHLVGGQRRLDPLDAVGAVDAQVVAGADALGEQVVGEAVGPFLELPVGAALGPDDEHLAIGDRVHGVLEEVGDVVGHEI